MLYVYPAELWLHNHVTHCHCQWRFTLGELFKTWCSTLSEKHERSHIARVPSPRRPTRQTCNILSLCNLELASRCQLTTVRLKEWISTFAQAWRSSPSQVLKVLVVVQALSTRKLANREWYQTRMLSASSTSIKSIANAVFGTGSDLHFWSSC